MLAPQPAALAALLRAERDAPGSCAGVRDVTTQLGDILNNPPPPLATPPPPKGAADAAGAGGKGKEAEKAEA